MQRVDPATIPEDCVKHNQKKLDSVQAVFSNPDDPDSQFIHVFAWASHFAEVCQVSREAKQFEDKLLQGEKDIVLMEEQKIRYEACLEDLKIFELDKIQEERDIIHKILTESKNDREKREAQMEEIQSRYLEYEADFFAQVNAAKRQSKVSGVQ